MLKCGQKDNIKYTFGMKKNQMAEYDSKEQATVVCYKCGERCKEDSKFCPSCGEKM